MTTRLLAPRPRVLAAGLLALAVFAVLASGARGAGMIYWGDFTAHNIMSLRLDGSTEPVPFGLGTFPNPPLPLGAAVDSATGRIYWADVANDAIFWAALDGLDGGQLDTTGAVVTAPRGVAIDPVARRIYWANGGNATIASASLDGGDGRRIDTTGGDIQQPNGVAIDPVGRRIYWTNVELVGSIGSAKIDDDGIGGDGRRFNTNGATVTFPHGLAIDPVARRIYWANSAMGVISSADLTGIGGGNLFTQATTSQAVYPILLLAPRPATPPVITGGTSVGSTLSCGQASWAPDAAEAFFFQAPQAVAMQWSRDGQDIPGANQSTLTATAGGDYRCTVTAQNHAGTTAQASEAQHVVGDVGGGGSGTGAPPAFDTDTRVTITLVSAVVGRRGPVKARIANKNTFAITGRLTARTTKPVAGKRRTTLRGRSFELAANRALGVNLTLPRALRSVLARRHRLALRLSVTVTDPAGKHRTILRTIALKTKPASATAHVTSRSRPFSTS